MAHDNSARQRILARVRSALAKPALDFEMSWPGRPMFAPVGDCLERFVAECETNLTECVLTPDADKSAAAIGSILSELPAGPIFLQDTPRFRQFASRWDGRELKWSNEGGPPESSQATITGAEGLVASTGSILVSSSCGGRGGSIVAPVHIVYATVDQLAPDLEAGFARLRAAGVPEKNSYVGLITGCSRTADIEKLLVIGAHGPRRLAVILQTGA